MTLFSIFITQYSQCKKQDGYQVGGTVSHDSILHWLQQETTQDKLKETDFIFENINKYMDNIMDKFDNL